MELHEILVMAQRILIAAFLGSLIGLERDSKGRAAGLRTQILVSIGSCLFMIISIKMVDLTFTVDLPYYLRTDPGRIAAQIITGIGFLGAGAIIKSGINVRGLTTASCIWVSSGIGMSCGMGLYEPAILTTSAALLVLIFLNYLERFYSKDSWRDLRIEVAYEDDVINKIINAVKKEGVLVHYCQFTKDYTSNTIKVTLSIKLHESGIIDKHSHKIMDHLEQDVKGIRSLSWVQKKD
jgi:putative Mg2+ transporter-C (MgtC) family protein